MTRARTRTPGKVSAGTAAEPGAAIVPTRLIVRESTARPRGRA